MTATIAACFHDPRASYPVALFADLRDEDYAAIDAALKAAPRSGYQRALVDGSQCWSGADLKGKAGKYGASYARTRRALVERIDAALPAGYSAESALVRREGEPREHRRLVIWTPDAQVLVIA